MTKNTGTWRDNVRRVSPYVPGEQPKRQNVIKLNTNENPYPPCPGVREVLRSLDGDALRRYPDPDAGLLVSAISKRYAVPEDRIFVGVGSDDVLAQSFLTFFHGEKPVLFPDITYSFYEVWANLFRIPYQTMPLNEAFHIRPEDYRKENGGIVIANPNAPTGEVLPREVLEGIVREKPGSVVIVDEAYIDFGGESMIPLIDRYDNLLVVQTFSKSRSMAGMRIGMAFGSRELIACLKDVKFSYNSYTMNLPSILAGSASMADESYFQETCRRIIATREWTKEALTDLGFRVTNSRTNFLFVSHPEAEAASLFASLREEGIFVRYFRAPRIDAWLRITIGTEEEMDALISRLKALLQRQEG